MNTTTTAATMNNTNVNTTAQKLVVDRHISPDALRFIKTLTVHLWLTGVGEREFSLKDGPEITAVKINRWIRRGKWFDMYDSGIDLVIFDEGGALYELSSGHAWSVELRLYDALQAVERKFASEHKDHRFEPRFVLVGKKYRLADKAKDGTVLLREPVVELDDYEY